MQKPEQITVLIVGKQTRELKSLKRRLSLEGLEVIRACGHQEVLRQIQEKGPGLVLLNVPQDPVEASQAIHAIKVAVQPLPVIALLRDVAWARGEGGPLAEADDCLFTPWRVGELLARFRAQLRISTLEQELDQVTRIKRDLETIFTEKLSALGEMISGTAHELNSPLSAILLYSQLLQQAEVGKKVRKGLETIQGEATRCQKIVQHLLSFARQHKPEKQLVSINDILESTQEHGGSIYAQSRPGQGAAFIIELPVVGQSQREEVNGLVAPGAGVRIEGRTNSSS